jgi:hypothetical protein
MKENAGYLVETKDGKQGRTYHAKGLVNGKVPVYLLEGDTKIRIKFSDCAILCDPKSLTIQGYLD